MENTAVILVGGLGLRLRPLTKTIPKPLLRFGSDTILEIIVNNLSKNHFNKIILAARYRSEKFKKEIKKLEKKFPKITFELSVEKKPLGTCGPLKLLEKKLPEFFLVLNGDVITNVKFKKAEKMFLSSKSPLLIFSKEIKQPFDFGQLIVKKNKIVNILEKPILKNEIVAGIYYFKKSLIKEIPRNKYYGMDDLIKMLLRKKTKIDRHLIEDFWLDVGDMNYFERNRFKD